MSPTTLDEDVLRTDLACLAQSAPPPVTVIERRAQHLRRRHRTRVLTVVGASGAVLTLAAAGTVQVIGWERGSTGEVPICTGGQSVFASAVETSEMPAALRLAWTDPSLPDPAWANGRLIEASCAQPATFKLTETRDDVVVRTADLQAYALGPDGQTPWDVPPQAEPSQIRDFGADAAGTGLRRVSWTPGDGFFYNIETRGFTEADMATLAASTKVKDGAFDVSKWEQLSDFDIADYKPLPEDGSGVVWLLGTQSEEAETQPAQLLLEVSESRTPLLLVADGVGQTVVSVGEKPALQSGGGVVTWKPTPGVVAHLSGAFTNERLLEIAQTVGPVDASQLEGLPRY